MACAAGCPAMAFLSVDAALDVNRFMAPYSRLAW
jgi:hypothetical protein